MPYRINVSKNGKHVFTTSESNTATNSWEAARLYGLFRDKFPSSEGYKVDIAEITTMYCDSNDKFERQYQQTMKGEK